MDRARAGHSARSYELRLSYRCTTSSQDDQIIVSGEFPLKQTDLGLTPFSALLGALQVVDEMKVRFHIVAHAATTQTGHWAGAAYGSALFSANSSSASYTLRSPSSMIAGCTATERFNCGSNQ